MGFGRVLGDLAALGYDTEWDCIPAAYVGAPHLRYRVFIVAWPASHGVPDAGRDAVRVESQRDQGRRAVIGPSVVDDDGGDRELADADDAGRVERRGAVAVPPQLRPVERSGEAAGGGGRSDGGGGTHPARRRVGASGQPTLFEDAVADTSSGGLQGAEDGVTELSETGGVGEANLCEAVAEAERKMWPTPNAADSWCRRKRRRTR